MKIKELKKRILYKRKISVIDSDNIFVIDFNDNRYSYHYDNKNLYISLKGNIFDTIPLKDIY